MSILVPKIVVPKQALAADDGFAIYEACLEFLSTTIGNGYYRRDEYPHELIMLDQLDTYLGQVSNGGHEQYVSNKDWDQSRNESLYRFMLTIGAEPFAELFQRFMIYVGSSAQTRKGMEQRGGFETVSDQKDEGISKLDTEFFNLKRRVDIYRLASEHMKRSGLLEVVDRERLRSRLDHVIGSNPHRAEREADFRNSLKMARVRHERKANACQRLMEMTSDRFDPSSGTLGRMHIDGIEQEVTAHKTHSGRYVVYQEDGQYCWLLTYPEGAFLAKCELKSLNTQPSTA